jgi:parallel beta-helix repeat protein
MERVDCSRISGRPLQRVRRSWAGPLWAAVIASAACGGPTGPTTSVSITGTSVLTAVGQTSQLIAKDTNGADITRVVTWQSSNTAVATVSASGLVIATGLGETTIQATYQSTSSLFAVFVGAQSVTTVTACGFLSAPGTYLVTADLTTSPGSLSCLNVTISNIQLNCQGHAVSNITIASGLSGLAIANCITSILAATQVTNLSVIGSTLTQVVLTAASGAAIQNNTFGNTSGFAGVTLAESSGAVVRNNTFNGPSGVAGRNAAIVLHDGMNNQVIGNTINGFYDGGPTENGVDDGVLLSNESGDLVQGNTISNCFDTGVEGLDSLTNTTIADNTMTNIGASGVATYWCTHWLNNVIRDNSVSETPGLFKAVYSQGTNCGSQVAPIAFSNNQLVGNRFRDPAAGYGSAVVIVAPRMIVSLGASSSVITANLLLGNDFGSEEGPELMPLNGFIDGGGNICAPLSASSAANFACSSGTANRLARILSAPRGSGGGAISAAAPSMRTR